MRVLEEAFNTDNPLLERMKFLAISSSNLNEFVMVRIAGLKDQVRNDIETLSNDGLTPKKQLEKINLKTAELMKKQQECWTNLKKELRLKKIIVEEVRNLDESDIGKLRIYFLTNIFPALSPIAVDPAHPFPFLPNLGLAMIMHLTREKEHKELQAIILLPSKMERFVRICENEDRFVRIEEVIDLFKGKLFPGNKISDFGIINIIRDSDLETEDEADDLVSNFEIAVKKRRRGTVIQLKVKSSTPEYLTRFVAAGLNVNDEDIIKTDDILEFSSLMELYSCDRPNLKFKPYNERFPERINDFGGDYFAAIASKDIVIHHPYETFDVVIKFLQQAARDPDVVAIKQTLYRTSNDSPIVKALVQAAEAGKSVTAVVELKARFDEESNIRWARDLERAGAQVVYGFVGLKTHAKVSLVVRREGHNLNSYVHFGTGNYHPITARTYSDLSFFTCNLILCTDVSYLFNYLTGYSAPEDFSELAISPTSLRPKILQLIQDEIEHAKAGRPANIWAKMNALIDPKVIDALYEASQAGVVIDLIIRGVCGLRPGILGFSENIRVKSIVGRFLEHSRIMCFGAGNKLPSTKAKIFISSADWMQRNFDKRVEVLIPIENETVHEQIMGQIMMANLKDDKQSWALNPDGSYDRYEHGKKAFCAHEYFITNPSLSGRGKAITEKESEKQRKKIYKLLTFDKDGNKSQ